MLEIRKQTLQDKAQIIKEKEKMKAKKVVIIALLSAMSISLMACGKEEKLNNVPTEGTEIATEVHTEATEEVFPEISTEITTEVLEEVNTEVSTENVTEESNTASSQSGSNKKNNTTSGNNTSAGNQTSGNTSQETTQDTSQNNSASSAPSGGGADADIVQQENEKQQWHEAQDFSGTFIATDNNGVAHTLTRGQRYVFFEATYGGTDLNGKQLSSEDKAYCDSIAYKMRDGEISTDDAQAILLQYLYDKGYSPAGAGAGCDTPTGNNIAHIHTPTIDCCLYGYQKLYTDGVMGEDGQTLRVYETYLKI